MKIKRKNSKSDDIMRYAINKWNQPKMVGRCVRGRRPISRPLNLCMWLIWYDTEWMAMIALIIAKVIGTISIALVSDQKLDLKKLLEMVLAVFGDQIYLIFFYPISTLSPLPLASHHIVMPPSIWLRAVGTFEEWTHYKKSWRESKSKLIENNL